MTFHSVIRENRLTRAKSILVTIVLTLLILASGISPALSVDSGGKTPVWWPTALKEADQQGYSLLTPEELRALYRSNKTFLLLDVRPDYEYRSGHLDKAENFEFHLGDRLRIDPEKKRAFQELLGHEKNRMVIIYCRSFR